MLFSSYIENFQSIIHKQYKIYDSVNNVIAPLPLPQLYSGRVAPSPPRPRAAPPLV